MARALEIFKYNVLLSFFMGLFGQNPYMVTYSRGGGLRIFLLILGIALGLYYMNLAFLWIKIPALATGIAKYFNIFTGIVLIVLGVMVMIRRRY